ncbi:MAG: ABC transporter ATP-binding protein [Acidobacteriota bacterium]
MSEAFLRLVEVTKRFGSRTVVDRASLDVAEGEVVAILGASGCGKTTLLRLIAGLEIPDDGEIWIAGERVAANRHNLVPPHARNVGFVFQDLALWPHLTVAGNLDFVLGAARWPRRERQKRIDEVLRLVHIESFAQKYPDQLSGGEQQRAAIARALVAHSQLLLLDEPLSNLDADLKAVLLHELAVLQAKLKLTTVYVTHDRVEAATFAHRVALMKKGQIEQVITAELVRAQRKSQPS